MSLDRQRIKRSRNRHVSFSIPNEFEDRENLKSLTARASVPQTATAERRTLSSIATNRKMPKRKPNLKHPSDEDKISQDTSSLDQESETPKVKIVQDNLKADEIEESIQNEEEESNFSGNEEYFSDDSYTSYDSPVEKKKRWVIKLPWKRKIKEEYMPSIESLESLSDVDMSPNLKEKYKVSSLEESKTNKKLHSIPENKDKKVQKKRAFSWYGSKTSKNVESDSSYSSSSESSINMMNSSNKNAILSDIKQELDKKKRNQRYNKYDFFYSSSNDDDEMKKGGKKLEVNKKKSVKSANVSHSQPNLHDEQSVSVRKDTKKHLSDIESVSSSLEDVNEPQITKSNSLPSFIFKRNKKKRAASSRKINKALNYPMKIEPTIDSKSEDEDPKEELKERFSKRKLKTFKETPLVHVGLENIHSQHANSQLSPKEYDNNVESVSSIFKRISSYQRVYPTQEIASSVTYPRQHKEKKQHNEFSPLSRRQKKGSVGSSPKSLSHITEEKENLNENVTPRNNQSCLEKENMDETRNEKFQKEKSGISKQRTESISDIDTTKFNDRNKNSSLTKPVNSHMKQTSNQTNLSVITHAEVQTQTTFEKNLQRDIRQAKRTVKEVNNHFGNIIFSQVHKDESREHQNSSASEKLVPISEMNVVEETQYKVKKKSKKSTIEENASKNESLYKKEELRRRRSYEKMLNKLEEAMFDSNSTQNESSSVDTDEIDLSFHKNRLQIKKEHEVKCIETNVKMETTSDSMSDTEHVYHVKIAQEPLDNQLKKGHFEVKHPDYPPPPPPTSKNNTLTNNEILEQNVEKEQKIESRLKNNSKTKPNLTLTEVAKHYDTSSSDTDSSDYKIDSKQNEEELLKRKKRRVKREEEINRLIDISIKKYITAETPPPFTPPPLKPEPKFNAGINDNESTQRIYTNTEQSQDLHDSSISNLNSHKNDYLLYKNISTKSIANELFSKKREEHNKNANDVIYNLPIKNIKSLNWKDTLNLPPPPPRLPPSTIDPFAKSSSNDHDSSISLSALDSHQNYNQLSTKEKRFIYKKEEPLMESSKPFYFDFYSQEQSSPKLLRAEIIEKIPKSQPQVELKREYTGPYVVSHQQSQKMNDSKKQAVKFFLPQENDEPLYANNEADFTNPPPKLPPKPQNTEKIISPSRLKESSHPSSLSDYNKKLEHGQEHFFGSHIKEQSNSLLEKEALGKGRQNSTIEHHNVSLKNGTSNFSRTAEDSSTMNNTVNHEDYMKMNSKVETTDHSHFTQAAPHQAAGYFSSNVHTFPRQSYPLKSILRNSNKNTPSLPAKELIKSDSVSTKLPHLEHTTVASLSIEPQDSITKKVFNTSADNIPQIILDGPETDSSDIPPALPNTPPPPPRLRGEKQKFFGNLLEKENQKVQADRFAMKTVKAVPFFSVRKMPNYHSNLYPQPYGTTYLHQTNVHPQRPNSAQAKFSYKENHDNGAPYKPVSEQSYSFEDTISSQYDGHSQDKLNQNQIPYEKQTNYNLQEEIIFDEASQWQDHKHYQSFQDDISDYVGQFYPRSYDSQVRQESHNISLGEIKLRPFHDEHQDLPYHYLHHTRVQPYSPDYLHSAVERFGSESFDSMDFMGNQNYYYGQSVAKNAGFTNQNKDDEEDTTYQNVNGLKTDV